MHAGDVREPTSAFVSGDGPLLGISTLIDRLSGSLFDTEAGTSIEARSMTSWLLVQ